MQTEIVKYFNKILGYTAYPDQENVLNAILKEDEILISAGRGCGKTLVVAAAVTYMAEELDEPTKILVVSAQDSWVLYYLRQIYQKNNDLNDGLVSRSNQFVIPATGYSNNKGSDVFVRGASERSLRGPHVDVLIIDECALVPNESILTAFSCLVGSANPKVISWVVLPLIRRYPTPGQNVLLPTTLIPYPRTKINNVTFMTLLVS